MHGLAMTLDEEQQRALIWGNCRRREGVLLQWAKPAGALASTTQGRADVAQRQVAVEEDEPPVT